MVSKLVGVLTLMVSLAALGAEPPADINAGAPPRDNEMEVNDARTDGTGQEPSSPSAVRRPPSAGIRATDRLDLDTTVVTGNRELPKVLYIVPWKKAEIGDLPNQPFNTLLDEVLTPVDRDVFRRELTYFDVVAGRADATQSTSSSKP